MEWQYITGFDADELNELRGWFNKNLEKPTSFGRDKLRLGICWFKTASTEHISRIWKMVQALERNDLYVKKIRTHKPGYVIYENNWQGHCAKKLKERGDYENTCKTYKVSQICGLDCGLK